MPKDRQTIDNTSVQPESKVTFRGCIRSANPERLYEEGSRCEVLLRVENRHLLFDDQEGWQSILPDDEYYRVDATKMPKGDDRTIDKFLLTDIPGTKTFMNGNRVEFVGVDQGEADDWKAGTEDGPWTMCGIVSVSRLCQLQVQRNQRRQFTDTVLGILRQV
jgi:hypothetical protein